MHVVHVVKASILCILLLAASVADIRRREIPDRVNLCIAVLACWGFRPENLWGVLSAFPFLIAAMKGGMGGGDVKLVASCGLVVGLPNALLGSILGLMFLLLFCLVYWLIMFLFHGKAPKAFPMAPFLSAGFVIPYLIKLGGMA